MIVTGLVACTAPTSETSSTPAVPDHSHLAFGETVAALWSEPDGTQVLQVDVRNDGAQATIAATGTVEIVGKKFTAELFPATADGKGPRPLGPNEQGMLQVRLWGDSIHRCSDLPVVVQHDPTLDDAHQAPGVHRATIKMPCLRWDTPMDLRAIPALRDTTLDQASVKAAAGKTLNDVVNSRVSGRSDGKLCSDCHHATSAAKYNPPTPQGLATLPISPATAIAANQDGGCTEEGRDALDPSCLHTWGSTARGWAVRFNNTTTYPLTTGLGPKPPVVRAAFAQWLADGAQ